MPQFAAWRSPLLLTLALAALGFLAVTLAAASGWLLPADATALAWVAAWRDCGSIGLAAALSLVGAGEVSLLLTALLVAACLAQRQRRAAAGLLLLYFSLPIELALKHTLTQPLPGALYPIPGACEWYHPALTVATPHSYPSGYAIRVTYFFALAAVWLVCRGTGRAPNAPRPARFGRVASLALAMVLALLLASRLVLSWHWPSDLVGGALLGLALAAGTVLIAGQDSSARSAPAGDRPTP